MTHTAALRCASIALALAATLLVRPERGDADAPSHILDFNRDIRPILSNNCFVCHGPDTKLRKGKLRLDEEKDATRDRGGYKVVVPGKPGDSELYRRIASDNPREQMPPPKSYKSLTKEQVQIVRRWIEQGAKYQTHWSLVAPKRPPLPKVKDGAWPANAIDHFVLARLDKEGLKPAAEADARTLIRRLSFDLTGLPPSPQDVEAFAKDTSPMAYGAFLDRLLSSQHFGERMAAHWLDVVRYADSGGYHSDNERFVWMYRDYVIKAFNDNKPFDRFTVEQLGGDLLPGADNEQRVASGYNRLLQTTEEGGAQAKEYTAKYQADRVRNASSVWLGMTLACAECHDHKYDPFGTKEFYRFAAFFADIQERAVGRQEQTPLLTDAQKQRVAELDGKIAPLQKAMAKITPELKEAQAKWEAEAKGMKGMPKEVLAALAVEAAKRTAKHKQDLTKHFRNITPLLAEPRGQLQALEKEKAGILKGAPTTLVSMTGPPRTVRVLPRGNWLDDTGEIVTPGVPAALPALDTGARRATRLDLANWLVSKENPLTARVFVNRMWHVFFGQGLVKTPEDFGSQGAWPSHPELLDWLAVEFRESGWDVRRLIKLIVTSKTYRQSSAADEGLRRRDPYNLLLARQGRHRLDAEMIRDNALAVSGLLVHKVGGPSVKPYQPAGYWRYLNFPTREWQKDSGPNQYRRGLYTHWQRSFLHPSLLAFDAPTREECTAERVRSNTPQQALVLLNDPTYVEAARAFAERVVKSGGATAEARIAFAFREALQRSPRAEETRVLSGLYAKHLADYRADAKAAEALLRVGDRPAPKDVPVAELAAWMSVTRAILNLHETITRN